jgi:hypothetical protein
MTKSSAWLIQHPKFFECSAAETPNSALVQLRLSLFNYNQRLELASLYAIYIAYPANLYRFFMRRCISIRACTPNEWRRCDEKATTKNFDELLTYDWKGDLIAVFLAALVFIPFVAEWFYWTRDQLGQ